MERGKKGGREKEGQKRGKGERESGGECTAQSGVSEAQNGWDMPLGSTELRQNYVY